jgi:aromatic ring hydroxylase
VGELEAGWALGVAEETDEGLIVSGAKVVATNSALTHYNFVGNYGPLPVKSKEFSAIFMVPMNTPGQSTTPRPGRTAPVCPTRTLRGCTG